MVCIIGSLLKLYVESHGTLSEEDIVAIFGRTTVNIEAQKQKLIKILSDPEEHIRNAQDDWLPVRTQILLIRFLLKKLSDADVATVFGTTDPEQVRAGFGSGYKVKEPHRQYLKQYQPNVPLIPVDEEDADAADPSDA